MNTNRRCALKYIASAVSLLAAGLPKALADEGYPNRAVKIVVPFPPGAGTDAMARIVAQKLTEKFGRPFLVDNRPGAGGAIGSASVAKSPADGYTLLWGGTSPLTINPHIYAGTIGYDPIRDFAPVGLAAMFTEVIIVHPSVPAKSVAELVALAKARPGALSFGSAGSGNMTHLAGEMFKRMAGIDMVHVPFRGGAPALVALTAGDVQVLVNTTIDSLPAIRAGRVRVLAATTPQRHPALPDVPTMKESGFPEYVVVGWGGIVAPTGTPASVIRLLNAGIDHALRELGKEPRFSSLELLPAGDTPEAFGALIRVEYEKWGRVVRESGAKAD